MAEHYRMSSAGDLIAFPALLANKSLALSYKKQ